MRIITKLLLAVFAICTAAIVSAAPLITFDGTPDDYTSSQTYDGFDFNFSANGWGVVAGDFSCCPGENVLNGTNHLLLSGQRDNAAGEVTISKSGGGSFSIASFDSATAFLDTRGTMIVTGFFEGGGSNSITVDLNSSYQSHTLAGFVGLSSLVFAEGSLADFKDYGLGIDNLNIDAAGQVPEPATLALLGLGLAGLAASRRRKQ